MIRRFFSGKQLMLVVCLLLTVGILFLGNSSVSYAMEEDDILTERESNLTGTTQDRTNINDPGTSENADELRELNIANSVTVTYDNGNGTIAGPIRILITLTMLSLAPFLLIMLTSFTRIIIVLHFSRTALNTQTVPPNQVMIGLALFLTFFIMSPIITEINETALQPFDRGEISQQEAIEIGMEPLREFMYGQTQVKDVRMFMEIADQEWDGSLSGIPSSVLIPSFIVSELRTAFIIGFLIYIPFIVIDMVVASALMSMGMMMLPPTTISMPFKILLFILADGWNLIIGNLVRTFY
ncbi:MAG: flagellar type III secretion system pore protein FliP [Lachnospiraceae bacterium]|jgi:flagellar biosynthetic protein FliP|nr:flagellar type III secretion system pore protein FliP [Lachnospiraceae bacterium]